MKVPPTPIESTNPFADAAGGGLGPLGVGAVDSGGKASIAWNRAIGAATDLSMDAVAAKQAQMLAGSHEGSEAVLTPVPTLRDMGDEAAPMGAQWDRLSMTVASLVAWNLIGEMAPDSVEDLAALPISESGLAAGLSTGSEASQAELAVLTGAASGPMTQAETISTRIAGQTGVSVHDDLSLRQGQLPAAEVVRQVPVSTESKPIHAGAAGAAGAGWAGMKEVAAGQNPPYGSLAQLNPEIPTPLGAAAAQMAKADVSAPSTVIAAEMSAAQAQSLARSPAPTPQLSAQAGSAVQAGGRAGEPAPGSQSSVSQSVAPAAQQLASPVVAAADPPGQQPFQPSLLESLTSQELGKTGRQTSLRSEPMPIPDPMAAAIDGGNNVGPATQTISALERNFSVNEAVLDAEQISADEVQDLPLTDSVDFDIDIDDPGGNVRMNLSRQAEEVAIRLETPEKILDEYRDLQDEIRDALEDAGMSLADYEASSDSESQERSDESQGQAQTEPQDRESGPEETAGLGRLLNRIV